MTNRLPAGARAAFTFGAALAWLSVLASVFLSAGDLYPKTPVLPHRYGHNPDGAAGAVSRVIDTFSYFTVWSNLAVAVVWTAVARRPFVQSLTRRVLIVDSLLMITVTGIIYAVLLAPHENPTGVSVYSNALEHQVVPIVTVLVWLIWGPRGRVDARAVLFSFAIPLVWVAYMLVRGAVIGAYPYDFVNVATRGYGAVAVTIALILLFGVGLAALFWGLDVLRKRRSATPQAQV